MPQLPKLKNLIFITLLILLFVEVLIVFPAQLDRSEDREAKASAEAQVKSDASKTAPTTNSPEQKMGGVHLVESQSGNRDWELFSTSAEGSRDAGTWKLNQVKILFYNKEKVEFTVTGDTGTIDEKSRDIAVLGNVVTRSENGYHFKTPSIFYSSTTRLIQSPEDVVMEGPPEKSLAGILLKGRKMKVSVDESKMWIQEQVSATKPEKEGKSFEILADGAEFSGKTNEARFLGSVRMNYDGMRLEGPEAAFLYSQATKLISAVAVKGGVRVSDEDKFATSESVNLDLVENKYTFKGSPKVIQNNDELTGDEIIFLDGGKKVKVERVRAKVENKD